MDPLSKPETVSKAVVLGWIMTLKKKGIISLS